MSRMQSSDPRSALEVARALESSDWAAAIEVLEAANREARSDEVEIALLDVRHRAGLALTGGDQQPGAFAPPGPAPAVGSSGLPEARLADLDASTLRGAILEHGSLYVPGALDEGAVERLIGAIERSFAAADGWAERHDVNEPLGDPSSSGTARPDGAWWYPLAVRPDKVGGLGRKWVRGGGGVLLADAPRPSFELLQLFEEIGLRKLVSDYLGERPVISANKCTLRRVPVDSIGGWHQDGAFLGSGIRAINTWIALTPCGLDAPGLDIVPRRFDEICETGTGGSYFDWAVGQEVVEREAGPDGVVRPRFEAGDLLFFDEMCLHRTAIEPTMTTPRYAIEFWSFAGSAYPPDQAPVAW